MIRGSQLAWRAGRVNALFQCNRVFTPLARQEIKEPAAGRRERLIHATRSVAYGCTRQGLTRFATFLWVGPLPAPHRGSREAGTRLPRLFATGLRLARVDRHLTDHHGLLGPAVVVP